MTRLWPVLAAVAALVPVAGGFSTTHVFYVRDLSNYFWPRHRWLRETVLGGDWPWWDPYAAGGQSAVADALNQFFLLPVTLVRVALPPIPGFNFWVAAPFPVAAVGAWLWLRRYGSPASAFVGAAIFVAVGPVVSTGNFPNLSWAVACIPWALWATNRLADEPGAGRVATLATWMGLQAITGEPVTLAGTAVLVLVYAAFGHGAVAWRERLLRVIRVTAALTAGALLSAVQTFPLGFAATRSLRAIGVDDVSWSLHPLEIGELMVGHLFGHSATGQAETMPWMLAFHNREPLFVTLYVGVGALVLGAVASREPGARRRRVFWWAVAGVALLCALGRYTPFYPALQSAFPLVQSFRFPVKYLVFAMAALAALATMGADALLAHARGRGAMRRPVLPLALAGAVTAIGVTLGLGASVSPDVIHAVWARLGDGLAFADPSAATQWIVSSSPPLLLAVAAISGGVALLVAVVWSGHRQAPAAAVLVCAVAIVDPLVINRDAHPTMAAEALPSPTWLPLARRHPDRVYVGGRVLAPIKPPRRAPRAVDAAVSYTSDAALPFEQGNAVLGAEFAYFPAVWGVRESVSYDLPQLWPAEYALMIQMFGGASAEERVRFIRRTGNRYCYMADPPHPGAKPLTPPNLSTTPMALYACETSPRRVYVTPAARVVSVRRDQIRPLFEAAHDPYAEVLLEREPPPPAGRPGAPGPPRARIVSERNTEVLISASVGAGGGYVNALDTYDPGWQVEVDGEPAELLRANGIYRAVRLAPGPHEVRFRYRPLQFYAGLGVTLVTALALLLACAREWLTARGAARRMRLAATAS
ncbi:MAG: hypothetical protein FJW14_00085 [Acidimicrobiia bacterium]|nr:hypothetical protein [Acidimicrobiia bacterium]